MIRYLIAATDVNANASRWPLFTSPTNSEEYLGTIVNPTNLTSKQIGRASCRERVCLAV